MNRKPDTSLPDPVKGPEPVAKMTEIDKARGMWGHQLSSECSLGGAPVDSSDRVKTNAITPKVGSSWNLQFEQNGSKMKSGVCAGASQKEPSPSCFWSSSNRRHCPMPDPRCAFATRPGTPPHSASSQCIRRGLQKLTLSALRAKRLLGPWVPKCSDGRPLAHPPTPNDL
jgi:hypothetical protein